MNSFWVTVCKTVRPYAIGPLSVLPVCNVGVGYCGQTVGWMKMKLGTRVGLGLGHIVLDRDPAPSRKGAQQPPYFRNLRAQALPASV